MFSLATLCRLRITSRDKALAHYVIIKKLYTTHYLPLGECTPLYSLSKDQPYNFGLAQESVSD